MTQETMKTFIEDKMIVCKATLIDNKGIGIEINSTNLKTVLPNFFMDIRNEMKNE